jgi:hypothetical protein
MRTYYKDSAGAEQAEKAVRSSAETARAIVAANRTHLEELLKGKPGQKSPRPISELPSAAAALFGIGLLNHLDEYLAHPPLKRDGSELVVSFEVPRSDLTLGPAMIASMVMFVPTFPAAQGTAAVREMRVEATPANKSNNLWQIALAMLNYESAEGTYPQSAPRKNEKGQLSWRVHLLPYLEEQALYQEFHLDEPWDSEHNKKLIPRMPKVYSVPGSPLPSGQTYYKVFSGDQAIFGPGKKTKPLDISDGTLNTILVVEGGKPVTWTEPEDIPFDPAKPLPDLSLDGKKIIQVVMAEATVRTIDLNKVSEKTLKALITMNAKDTPGKDWAP